ILYGIFVFFPLPRFISAPHYLGYRVSVYIGVVSNVCEQVVVFAGAAIAYALVAHGSLSPKMALIARWTFGLCPVFFGVGNLLAIDTVVPLIPKWIPFGAVFWAVLTGIAFT